MLALDGDELGVDLAVGDVLGEPLDDLGLRGDRVGGDHVRVDLPHRVGGGAVAGEADDLSLEQASQQSSFVRSPYSVLPGEGLVRLVAPPCAMISAFVGLGAALGRADAAALAVVGVDADHLALFEQDGVVGQWIQQSRQLVQRSRVEDGPLGPPATGLVQDAVAVAGNDAAQGDLV